MGKWKIIGQIPISGWIVVGSKRFQSSSFNNVILVIFSYMHIMEIIDSDETEIDCFSYFSSSCVNSLP